MKELISRLTWVDFLAILAVLRGCYIGFRSGFFPELLRIAGYILTAIIAFAFQEAFAQYLTLNTILNEASAGAASLISLLVGVFIITKLIIWLFLKLLKIGEGGTFYRLLGMALGVCRWMILVSLLFLMVDKLPFSKLKADIHEKSVSGEVIAKITPTMFDFLSTFSPQLGTPTKKAS